MTPEPRIDEFSRGSDTKESEVNEDEIDLKIIRLLNFGAEPKKDRRSA